MKVLFLLGLEIARLLCSKRGDRYRGEQTERRAGSKERRWFENSKVIKVINQEKTKCRLHSSLETQIQSLAPQAHEVDRKETIENENEFLRFLEYSMQGTQNLARRCSGAAHQSSTGTKRLR